MEATTIKTHFLYRVSGTYVTTPMGSEIAAISLIDCDHSDTAE